MGGSIDYMCIKYFICFLSMIFHLCKIITIFIGFLLLTKTFTKISYSFFFYKNRHKHPCYYNQQRLMPLTETVRKQYLILVRQSQC